MNKLPEIDFAVAWACIPPDTQARIGAQAIKACLLMFASDEFESDEEGESIVYLNDEDRAEATTLCGFACFQMGEMIQPQFPELFGENPSDEHPRGTDPVWATPIRRSGACSPD